MQYDWILFDADETLFSFDAFAGLTRAFSKLGFDFTEQDFTQYNVLNQLLWAKYQNGEITSKQLQEERFAQLSSRYCVSPAKLNHCFLDAMAELCMPLEGVRETLPLLAKKAKLGIITNGFIQIQEARLNNTGLKEYFSLVVVSELVGVAKPSAMIFESAFEQMGRPDKARILMVGDNLASDILGANNAGIDGCWLNPERKNISSDITAKYVVSSWHELRDILLT